MEDIYHIKWLGLLVCIDRHIRHITSHTHFGLDLIIGSLFKVYRWRSDSGLSLQNSRERGAIFSVFDLGDKRFTSGKQARGRTVSAWWRGIIVGFNYLEPN